MRGEDIIAIVNVVNLYAVAVDTQKWALFDRVFTADCVADFGGPARWDNLAALKQVFDVIHAPFKATQHTTTNHQVVVTGDTATCLSYVLGRFIRDVGEGGNMFESGGWYDDRLIRTSEGWRIKDRICRTVWWTGNPRVLQTSPDVHVEPNLNSLRAEAAAGRVMHLDALSMR